MDKKLTLNVDEELIKFAHRYSRKTHQSISHLVERKSRPSIKHFSPTRNNGAR